MRKIHGYEDSYSVDILGNVHSVKSGKVLKPGDNGTGYFQVTLFKKGKRKRFYVHRLVAIAFNEVIGGKPHVNHINGKKDDNRAENLEWCTPMENVRHAREIGLTKPHQTKHGTVNEYNNYSCRCSKCKEVWRIYYSRRRHLYS